jgi:hypothetical protein
MALELEARDIKHLEPMPKNLPDWRFPYLQRFVNWALPLDQAEARRLARRAKTFVLIDGEMYKCSPSGCSCGASPKRRARIFFRRFTQGLAATTQRLRRWYEIPFDRVSTGPPLWQTPWRLFGPVRVASSMHSRPTSWLRLCRRSPSPGPSQSRASTLSGSFRRRLRASPTYWSQLTNFLSGFKSTPSPK